MKTSVVAFSRELGCHLQKSVKQAVGMLISPSVRHAEGINSPTFSQCPGHHKDKEILAIAIVLASGRVSKVPHSGGGWAEDATAAMTQGGQSRTTLISTIKTKN